MCESACVILHGLEGSTLIYWIKLENKTTYPLQPNLEENHLYVYIIDCKIQSRENEYTKKIETI